MPVAPGDVKPILLSIREARSVPTTLRLFSSPTCGPVKAAGVPSPTAEPQGLEAASSAESAPLWLTAATRTAAGTACAAEPTSCEAEETGIVAGDETGIQHGDTVVFDETAPPARGKGALLMEALARMMFCRMSCSAG